MEGESKAIGDYFNILKRRAIIIIVPFVILFAVSVAVALLLPPIYRSTALVLVESQRVPGALVQSTITGYVDERIQVIKQRAMSSSVLVGFINKYNLFPEERKRQPQSVILEQVREAINVSRVTTSRRNPRGGRATSATIAFNLSYESKSPRTAQTIANELVTVFLGENTRSRSAGAAETTEFLARETEKLRRQAGEIEKKIAKFKEDNVDSLPNARGFIQAKISSAEGGLTSLENRLREIEEQRTLKEARIRAIKLRQQQILSFQKQNAMIKAQQRNSRGGKTVSGKPILSRDAARLEQLRAQRVSLAAVYGPSHPDVKVLENQIEAFEKAAEDTVPGDNPADKLAAARNELDIALQKWSEQHPDVISLRKRVSTLEAEQPETPPPSEEQPAEVEPLPFVLPEVDRSALIQLETELDLLPSRIEQAKKQRDRLKNRIEELETNLAKIPQNERLLGVLTRDRQDIIRQYTKLTVKQQEAKLSESLETEQKGEKFTLLEPPIMPVKPIKPDRIKILLGGFALSLMAGLGIGLAAEGMDKSIRGAGQLIAITHQTPLAVIPYIETESDKRKLFKKVVAFLAVSTTVVVLTIGSIHVFVKPLDVLWTLLIRRFGLY